MANQRVRPDDQLRAAQNKRDAAELERRVKAEGLDLNNPAGKERFNELVRRATQPKK